jgi:DNA-binding MarR family transcriptional regulator
LLNKSEEGISSNILSDRLKTLLDEGIVTRADDPTHKQKSIYSLTEQGIELLPILMQMAAWGYKYLPVTEELGIRAKLLSDGGDHVGRADGRTVRNPSRLETEASNRPKRRRTAAGGL